jgi:acylphosphatase
MLQTISISIRGKVQGVFFRQSAREKAKEIGVTGFVRNEPDDTVFITATGTAEQLSRFTDWCRQGPPRARVTGIVTNGKPLEEFDSFSIDRS